MLHVTGRMEVVFTGKDALTLLQEWVREYHPAVLFAGATEASGLSLLADRIPADGSSLIYVCRNRACALPVSSLEEAKLLANEMV